MLSAEYTSSINDVEHWIAVHTIVTGVAENTSSSGSCRECSNRPFKKAVTGCARWRKKYLKILEYRLEFQNQKQDMVLFRCVQQGESPIVIGDSHTSIRGLGEPVTRSLGCSISVTIGIENKNLKMVTITGH